VFRTILKKVTIIFYSALKCDLCNRFCGVDPEHLSICYIKFVLKGLKHGSLLKSFMLTVLLTFEFDKLLSYLNLLSSSPLLTYSKSRVSCEALLLGIMPLLPFCLVSTKRWTQFCIEQLCCNACFVI